MVILRGACVNYCMSSGRIRDRGAIIDILMKLGCGEWVSVRRLVKTFKVDEDALMGLVERGVVNALFHGSGSDVLVSVNCLEKDRR